jgi:hypothetical protein
MLTEWKKRECISARVARGIRLQNSVGSNVGGLLNK